MTLKKLVASRKSYEAHLGKVRVDLDALKSDEGEEATFEVNVKALLSRLSHVTSKLGAIGNEILDQIEDEDEVEKEVEEQMSITDISMLEARLQSLEQRSPSEKQSRHSSSCVTADAGLPTLSLPTFDGDYLRWRTFLDRFKAAVEREIRIKEVSL